jgi:hypothetical protein
MTRPGVIFIAPATVLPVLSLAYAKGELWRFWLFDEDEWDNLTLKFDTEDDFAFSLH